MDKLTQCQHYNANFQICQRAQKQTLYTDMVRDTLSVKFFYTITKRKPGEHIFIS